MMSLRGLSAFVSILMLFGSYEMLAQISGTIASDTTWTAASSPVSVTEPVTVPAGISLTVEPGTVVMFATGGGIVVEGTLVAAGTAADTIVFTSASGSPARGDWNGIEFANTSNVGSVFEYVKVEYVGGGVNQAGIFYRTGAFGVALSNIFVRESSHEGVNVRASSPTIVDSRFEGMDGFGVFSDLFSIFNLRRSTIRECAEGGIRVPLNAAPTIDSCTIENNGDGIYVANGAAPTITGNIIQNNTNGIYYQSVGVTQPVLRDNTIQGNTIYGIKHDGSSDLNARYNYWGSEYGPYNESVNPTGRGDTVSSRVLISPWKSSGTLSVTEITTSISTTTEWTAGVYWIKNTITVTSPATLTLKPGVIMKFAPDTYLTVQSGAGLVVDGTTDSLVVFTSEKDDSYGGDSNGDGEATQPSASDWQYARVLGSVTVSNLILKYSSFGLYLSVSATVDSLFASANSYGLYSESGSPLTITNSAFGGNSSSGVSVNGSAAFVLNVSNSSFIGNGQYGLYLQDGTISTFTGSKATFNGNIGVRGYQSTAVGSSTFSGNEFSHNGQHGLWYGSANGSGITVSGNAFDGNDEDGLVVTKASIQNNIFNSNRLAITLMGNVGSTYSGNVFAGNTYSVVGIRADDNHLKGTLSTVTPTGLKAGVYLSYTSSTAVADTLQVLPGVIVKMASSAYWNMYGLLDIQGTAGSPVTFTSYRDHSAGGNILASGDTASAQRGDWQYLRFLGSQSSVIAHMNVLYSATGLYLSASPWQNTITNLTAWYNSSTGVYSESVPSVTIENSSFRYDGTGVWVNNGELVLRYSDVSDNSSQGLVAYTGSGPKEISNSTFERNSSNGINAANVTGPVTMVGNVVNANGDAGVYYKNTTSPRSDVQFIGNTVTNNGQEGIVSSRARFVDNTFTGNNYAIGFVGLLGANYADNSGVDGNVISGNTNRAISLREGVGDTLQYLFPAALQTHTYVIPSGSIGDYGTSPLIIEPGVILKFGNSAYMNKYRRLEAVGTPQKPIIWTSWRDSTYGGKTNAVSDTAGPKPGDWQYVRFLTGGDAQSSRLEHVVARYSSYPVYISGVSFTDPMRNMQVARNSSFGFYFEGGSAVLDSVTVDSSGSAGVALYSSASVSVTNSRFRDNTSQALSANSTSEFSQVTNSHISGSGTGIHNSGADAPQVFQGNTIENNSSYGIYVTASNASVDTLLLVDGNMIRGNGTGLMSSRAYVVDNVFQENDYPLGLTGELSLAATGNANGNSYQGNSFVDNQYDAIMLNGNVHGVLGGTKPDSLDNRVYRFASTLTVPASTELQIRSGSILKGVSGSNINVYGLLDIAGTTAERVVMTSWKDDTYGGDSNRDSSVTLPSTGDIGYIRLVNSNSTAIHTVNSLNYRYGNYALSVENVNQLTVDSSLFSNNSTALYRSNTGTTTVTASNFRDNAYGLQNYAGGSVTISNSNFENNSTVAITQGFNSTIEAANNYWGAVTGPLVTNGPDLNTGGTGDKIDIPTGTVNYRPFYTSRSGVLAGDVSQNGEITAFDASLVLRHVVEVDTLQPLQQAAADVTADGTISALDASMILRYVVGYISGFKTLDQPVAKTIVAQTFASFMRPTSVPEEYELVVRVKGEGIYATEMRVTYDASLWSKESVSKTVLSGEFMMAEGTGAGSLKVAMAGAVAAQGDDEWLIVRFRSLSPGASEDKISIESFTFNEPNRTTAVGQETDAIPTEFALQQNYPNPFNPSTTIRFDVPAAGTVSLSVYDILGRVVSKLVHGESAAGSFSLNWDGTSDSGVRMASGVYFMTMHAQSHDGREFHSVKKMILTR